MKNDRDTQFKQWLEQHKGLIFKIVRAYAASNEDQDDLFQNILLQLWSSLDSYQAKAKETTWIYRVALNTALHWQRGETRRRKRRRTQILEFRTATSRQGEHELPYDSQAVEELYQAIRKLPVIDSSIIVMHLDGATYDEMAEVVGISASHVGVRLNRAKKRLAKLMKRAGNGN